MLFRSFLKNWALWMSTENYHISKDEKRSFFVKSVYLLIKSRSISNVEDPSTVVWCRLLLENDFSFNCPRKIIVKKASILVTHHYFFLRILFNGWLVHAHHTTVVHSRYAHPDAQHLIERTLNYMTVAVFRANCCRKLVTTTPQMKMERTLTNV